MCIRDRRQHLERAFALLKTCLLYTSTDVEMPGLDGFALTRHVRSHPRAKDIAIIMVTSADDRLKEAATEAGVTLVLGKPYEEAALLACIEQAQSMNPAPVPV